MRRAALATLICAVPLLAAPAQASSSIEDRQALRAALGSSGHAARGGPLPLPLPEPPAPARASASRGELAALARSTGPERVLVGARTHADVPGLAAELRALGAEPETLGLVGVLAARVPSGAQLVAALRGDPRVAYVERDRTLRIAADPFDAVDPSTGIKFTWFFDDVHAAEAIAAAGGGSSHMVSVIDTGLDVTHPEFAGRVARTFDSSAGGDDVSDAVGHGTFVSGLIAAIDGNGIGGKGVAGNTRLVAVRASLDGSFMVSDLVRAIDASVATEGVGVLNMSLAGGSFTRSQARALEAAFFNDVLPVAASGNRAEAGNPIEFPAAAIGGLSGGLGIGLSVGATTPIGVPASFSNHNRFVSIAAPGAGAAGTCEFGVLSTLPASLGTEWDKPESCSRVFPQPEGRYAYGEGTSFSAPIVSGIAALVWQVEPGLASEQVADVLQRSARHTFGGPGWNEFTGYGIVDGAAGTALARLYDITPPPTRGRARRAGRTVVRVRLRRSRDRTQPGRELAKGVTYGLLVSRDGRRSFGRVGNRSRRPPSGLVRLRGRRPNIFVAVTCDGNGNCSNRTLGSFRRR
jgi:subtilisin family serine protease